MIFHTVSGAEDTQAQMLAAISRLTAAVDKQSLQIDALHANQASAPSVLEALQLHHQSRGRCRHAVECNPGLP